MLVLVSLLSIWKLSRSNQPFWSSIISSESCLRWRIHPWSNTSDIVQLYRHPSNCPLQPDNTNNNHSRRILLLRQGDSSTSQLSNGRSKLAPKNMRKIRAISTISSTRFPNHRIFIWTERTHYKAMWRIYQNLIHIKRPLLDKDLCFISCSYNWWHFSEAFVRRRCIFISPRAIFISHFKTRYRDNLPNSARSS